MRARRRHACTAMEWGARCPARGGAALPGAGRRGAARRGAARGGAAARLGSLKREAARLLCTQCAKGLVHGQRAVDALAWARACHVLAQVSAACLERVEARGREPVEYAAEHLGCHGARYIRYARGWYAYPVRTVRGALGASSIRRWPPRGLRLVRTGYAYQPPALGTYRRCRAAVRVSSAERGHSLRLEVARAEVEGVDRVADTRLAHQ